MFRAEPGVRRDADTEPCSLDALASSDARRPALPSRGLALGARIGRYELLGTIGSGAMGTLYRAHDPHLGRDIALKLLHASAGDSELQAQSATRLLREVRVLARLSHPNVVAAYDIGTCEGSVFIAMELIEGRTLREWLTEPHDSMAVLRVLIAAGRGLVAAHAAGVLHRDFNPANVMVSSDGRVRVIDFGLARRMVPTDGPQRSEDPEAPSAENSRGVPASSAMSETLTRPSAPMGTPGYIAPEQLLGEPIAYSSDQFSYAVTAFVALTGHEPYPHAIDSEQTAALIAARPAWPQTVPRVLHRIVERGLALKPEDRYRSLAAMVQAFERVAWPRRRSVWLGFAGVLAASVVLTSAMPREQESATVCNVDETAFRGVWDATVRARACVERISKYR